MNETEDLKKFNKKIITPLIVLSATAFIALFTYFKHYPVGEWLLIVLCSLVVFVAISLLFEKMIMRFMDVNNEKALALKAEEEKLLEEENPEEETLEGQEETDSESMEVRDILE
jgi:flagellar biosynthesis/type III secretory pathway M-ring protein FliF/YscJ